MLTIKPNKLSIPSGIELNIHTVAETEVWMSLLTFRLAVEWLTIVSIV